MSSLTAVERYKLERALGMESGYVLNFSNRTFSDFILRSVRIDIYGPSYGDYGSKASRLRKFFTQESDYAVGKLIGDFLEAWKELGGPASPPDDIKRIVQRLKESAPVPDLEYLDAASDEKGFETLTATIKDAIEQNKPENGLDRLHTYLVKYMRTLCEKRGITTDRDKPLHSLAGEYIKALKTEGKIQSEMTERILKSSISILDAFNKVRNDESFAHDNPVLNYDESILIYNYVTSSIRFIRAIETGKQAF